MNMDKMRKEIDHVIVVILENRSFDNLLGWLYDTEETSGLKHIPPLKSGECPFYGLAGQDLEKLANSAGKLTFPPRRGVEVLFSPQSDPHEPYLHVNVPLASGRRAAAPASLPGLQSRQLHADACFAKGGPALVAYDTTREACQDRGQSCPQ